MFGLIERVIIPSLVIFLLLGGVSGVLLGGALVWRSDAALRFVARMDRWYSSPRLRAAEETMHTPLEPRVEVHPRAAGWIIAAASLLVALGMVVLIVAKLHQSQSRRSRDEALHGGGVPGHFRTAEAET